MQHQAQQSFVALLHAAATHNVLLNRTKIAKLLYLADLRAVEQGRGLFTGYIWRWRYFGPYDNALLEVEDTLAEQGIIESTPTTNYYGSPERRIQPRQLPPARVDHEFLEIIFGIVNQYGHMSASSLRDVTYQTPPMEDAVEDEANEGLLDFADVRPAPEVSQALGRLRTVVQAAGPGADESEAMEGLSEDIAVFSAARKRANQELLD